MTFQHPEYNWAFLLLLIPILIHLLKFRREPTLYFPGVFRLKEILKSSQRSKRIRHWLILITRLALWSLIILSFSKPSLLPNSQSSFTSQTRLVLWDNSPSM
ncbi:MAG: BatA domain-containing protein, partial [Bacteroidia bacterium]